MSTHFHEELIFGIQQAPVDLLTPYATLMQPLKKFSPESIRAIARSPNIDLQSIGIYFKSDIQHHIRTQQFQELLAKMDTIQRHSTDQNLRKFAETAVFFRHLGTRL